MYLDEEDEHIAIASLGASMGGARGSTEGLLLYREQGQL